MKNTVCVGAFVCLLGLAVPLSAQTYYPGDRSLWLMNGSGSVGVSTTLDLSFVNSTWMDINWHIAATGNFHGSGSAACDILWENLESGDRVVWLMSGSTFSSEVYLTNAPPDWRIVGVGSFHTGGTCDIVWENLGTGDRCIWLMSGTTFSSGVDLGVVATDWHIAGVADFNCDGKSDLLWENSNSNTGSDPSAGQHSIWLMNGTTFSSGITVGVRAAPWRAVCAADFDHDSPNHYPDILWENTSTGERSVWLLAAGAYSSVVTLPTTSTSWRMAAAADFNADGRADILLEYFPPGDADANGLPDTWERSYFTNQTGVDPNGVTYVGGVTDNIPYVIKQQLGLNTAALATTDNTIALKVTKPQ